MPPSPERDRDATLERRDAPLGELRARLGAVTVRDEHRLRRRVDRLRRTEDPQARGDALARVAADVERAEGLVARRRAAVPARIEYPPQLPVSARRDDLLAAIRDHQVVIVAGETGSGKTTQLPKICLELGRGIRGTIAHTQPRRLAARTVAERIAEELHVPLGEAVGYAVRFSDRSREDTLVRLMTDGLLLAEIQSDRLLRRYDTIIIDEAHERSLNIDFLLGYVRRILPQRPDLKVIITSATIDPQRFSRHFDDAPVVEVSGRTYPVEVRYRPIVDPDDPDGAKERDQPEAIGDAVEELMRDGRGDVLVFLSGESEIRDTADTLAGRFGSELEVLPLYARLSTAEQHRVFEPHTSRRVVLATNVAETSLTVPGIHYVVDPGTARISRYSARLKVQRLPIEPISQASADQRKGRSGRTANGIAIRLYTEEDFERRPRFTDPEIQRTSLASVILQMAALGLGEIEDFPFLDPPDRRQVRDGMRLLHELGAIDPDAADPAKRLTPLGRRLAQLPVDPRMGRMVLEADRLGCANEVIVIAAALSIQDPRERPADAQQAADQQHARFADETSDFLAYLNLWRYLREQQRALSNNQFRRRVRSEYLHYLRVREWQDLVGQLRGAARGVGVTINQEPAEPQQIHVALLAGLLSHMGMKDGNRRDYQGARNARFQIFPGSALARKQPPWIMVAELVETSRLWGRTAARVQPEWAEPLAEHLLQRSYSEPRWDALRGSVVATERVTLYGLPIVAGRTVQYSSIDPELSRELFIRRALVEGDWEARHHFLDDNRALVAEVQALEDRARRRDILVDDQAIHDFFDERVPRDVVSGGHFDRWWRDERRRRPELLTFTRELLVNADAAAAIEARNWPTAWRQGELTLPLSYRFEPGVEDDGVTVHVPLAALAQLRPVGFDWLVPGLRAELVTTLIRSLPKDLRRPLVPVPEVTAQLLAELEPRRRPLLDALAEGLERLRGVRVPREAWDPTRLPPHLRMRFCVEDQDGAPIAAGHDLDRLREEVRPRLRAQLAAAAPELERHGLRSWTIGTLPREVTLPGTQLPAYPALVDEGETAGVRVLDTPQAQRAAMVAGTKRLLLLSVPSPVKSVRMDNATQLALTAAPHAGPRAVLEDAAEAAVAALLAEAGGPAWDEPGFTRLRGHVAGSLVATTERTVREVARVLDAARDVRRRLEPLTSAPLHEARRDVEDQLRRLLYPGFVAATGIDRLPDVERYLRAAARRLERLADAPAKDLERMREIHELEEAYHRRLAEWPRGRPLPGTLRQVPWMLEELRVSVFAQALGTRGSVSPKRIRRALEDARAAGA
ncbi:MAG: ATP-dependent helicase HrpA [Solirubrobacteraceae bacterium]|nr:ATP-dependent helicase HrpA [Solirubrobacteraceae bacterium]